MSRSIPGATERLPSPTLRLFYALWPDATVLAALLHHQRRWRWPAGVAMTRPERLHMTLHFLGAAPRALLPALVDALPREGEAFELHLTQAALWRGGLAVLLAPQPPPALVALHQRLGTALQALGLPVETRPFAPHVTLARRAQQAQAPQEFEPVVWHADGAVLVESVWPQGGYRVLAGLEARGSCGRAGV